MKDFVENDARLLKICHSYVGSDLSTAQFFEQVEPLLLNYKHAQRVRIDRELREGNKDER